MTEPCQYNDSQADSFPSKQATLPASCDPCSHYVDNSYRSQDKSKSETNNKCQTCGVMLARHCAHCINGKFSPNAKSRNQPKERGEGQNVKNPGHNIIDTVRSDSVWVKNEQVDSVYGDESIGHEQNRLCCVDIPNEIDGRQPMQNPEQKVQTNVKMESSKNESDTVNSDSDGVKNEPCDSVVGDHTIDHEQTQQCGLEMLPTIKESPSVSQVKDCRENLVNCNDLIKASPLLSAALHAGNAVNDKGSSSSFMVVFLNKSSQPQTNQQNLVKTESLLKKNILVSSHLIQSVNVISAEDGIIDNSKERTVEEKSNQSSVKIISNPVISGNYDNIIYLESGSQQNACVGIGKIQQLNSSVSAAAEMKDVSDSGSLDVTVKVNRCHYTSIVPYCDICKKNFTAVHSLRVHKDTVHSRLKPFQCDTCGKAFGTRSSLSLHRVGHYDTIPHQCGLCQKAFKTLQALKSHSAIHSDLKRHACEICGKGFRQKGNLLKHERTVHASLKTFKCDICSTCYFSSHTLRNHIMSKHMPRPGKPQQRIKKMVEFDTCGKMYDSYYMKLHKMTHTGKKPHVCKVCGKGFVQNQTLKQHELVHTGQKPYSYKMTNKTFPSSSSLSARK